MSCAICVSVCEIIKSEIKLSNISIHTATMIATVACDLLMKNKTVSDTCSLILNDINKITNYICSGLTPNQTCTRLHLC